VAPSVVQPDGTLPRSYGRDERAAVRRHGDSFLFGRPRGNLLRLAIAEPLTPDMGDPAGIGAEVHPLPVGRPCGKITGATGRADLLPYRTAVHRGQAAPHNVAPLVHLHHQHPSAVG